MKPFHDLGMKHSFYVASYDAGTEGYDTVGLPAFKFCQDPVENDIRSYHTNMDVFDRLVPEYFKQGAVIVASFLYHTAMRDEKTSGRSRARLKRLHTFMSYSLSYYIFYLCEPQ